MLNHNHRHLIISSYICFIALILIKLFIVTGLVFSCTGPDGATRTGSCPPDYHHPGGGTCQQSACCLADGTTFIGYEGCSWQGSWCRTLGCAGPAAPTAKPPASTPTPTPEPACGRITNSQLTGISGVQVQVYNDTFGQQTRTTTTNSNGNWSIQSFLRNGDGYAVRVSGNFANPQTAPAGYIPPAKTSTNSWSWNHCLSYDVPNGSPSYECQVHQSDQDVNDGCSGPNLSSNSCRCNFIYDAAPTPTPVCNPPTNLTGSCAGPSGPITLNWNDSNNETYYKLSRRVNSEWNYDYINPIGQNSITTNDTDVGYNKYNNSYDYNVWSCCGSASNCNYSANQPHITCPTPTPTNVPPSCGTLTYTGDDSAGETVAITAPGVDPNLNQTLTYNWTKTCGTLASDQTQVASVRSQTNSPSSVNYTCPVDGTRCTVNSTLSDGVATTNCTGLQVCGCGIIAVPTLNSPADNYCTKNSSTTLSASAAGPLQYVVDDENTFSSPWLFNNGWIPGGSAAVS